MASTELQRLWKLAQIDRQIQEIKQRAANLDVGQNAQTAINKLNPEYEAAKTAFRSAEQSVTDLELKQKGEDQKLKKIHQEMFGGKVVNPKEVLNLEREKEMIERHRDADSEQLLELYDSLPKLEATYRAIAQKVETLEKQRDERRKLASSERSVIESAYKEVAAKRPEAAKGIQASLLARYDHIRQNHGGLGMVEVVKKTGNCGGCGTHLPERTLTLLREDKVAICESCHRLLYYSEGAI